MGYNSTIISKKKVCVTCGRKDYIFSKGDCKSCSTIRTTNKRMEKYEDEVDIESRKNLIEDLDTIVSLVVRHSAANKDGEIICYTCDKKITIATAQCSHFIPRAHMGLRFYLPNLKAACETCNVFKDGNIPEYEKRLERDNPGQVEELRQMAHDVSKPSISDLKSLLSEMRYKFELVKKK